MLLRRNKTKSRIQAAEKALRKGDLKTAIAAFEETVAANPEDVKSRKSLADAYCKAGKFEEAVGEYQALAGSFAANGLLLKAISACKSILDIDPDHTETQATLAKLYAKKRGGGLGKSTTLSPAMSAALPSGAPAGAEEHEILEAADVAVEEEIIDADDIAEVEIDDDDELIVEAEDVAVVDEAPVGESAGPTVAPPPEEDEVVDWGDDEDEDIVLGLDDVEVAEEAVAAAPPAEEAAPQEDEAVDWGDDDEDEAVDWGDDDEDESISLGEIDAELEAEATGAAPAKGAAKPAANEESLDLGEVEEALADELADEFADFHEAELELDHLDADELVVGEEDRQIELDGGALPEFPLFSDLSLHAFEQLIAKLEPWSLPPGAVVVDQGDVGDSFFVIVSGTVEVERDDERLAVLGPGEFFGEMALLSDAPRSASVVTTSEAELFEIKRSLLDDITAQYPSVEKVMMKFCRERLLRDIVRSTLFEGMSEDLVREMVEAFKTKRVDAGKTIVKQGNKGRGLYVIMTGEVDVTRDDGEGEHSVSRLREGEVFGEMSLLYSEPASATVTAVKSTTLLMLSRQGFGSFCERHPLIRDRLEKIGEERREQNESAVAAPRMV
jgi:CRP-like cAMP-binding protein